MAGTTYGPATIDNQIFTRISDKVIVSKMLENMRKLETPIANRLIATKGEWKGEHTIRMPFMLGEWHSLPSSITLATQWQQPVMTHHPNLQPGFAYPIFLAQPIFMGAVDEAYANAEDPSMKLVDIRTKDVMDHLPVGLQRAVMRGTTTTGSWVPDQATRAWNGINAINGIDFATGFLEEADSGNNVVHTIDRSVYPATSHPKFHHVVADFADTLSTTYFDEMVQLQTRSTIRGFDWNKAELFASETFLANVAKIQRTYMVGGLTSMDAASEAYKVPLVMGKPAIPCVDMPTNGANTATTPLSLAGLKFGGEGLQLLLHPKWSFTLQPWMDVPGTVGGRIAFVKVAGQLVCTKPTSCFAGVNGEQYS